MCRNPYYSKEYKIYCPCRQCEWCHKKRISHWTIRLADEIESSPHGGFFITLTYANEHLPPNFSLCKKDVQDWMKRLRKRIYDKLCKNRKIKYFIAGEYGSQTNRPHYHAVIYNLSTYEYFTKIDELTFLIQSGNETLYKSDLWEYGHITIGYNTSSEVLRYVAKYINKKTYGKIRDRDKRTSPFHLSSQGLGLAEAFKKEKELKEDLFIRKGDMKLSIPPYYRKKLGITAEDYESIIKDKEKELIKTLEENKINIYEKYLTPDIESAYIKCGFHINNEPITMEAFNYIQSMRKTYNDNLRSKRKLSEEKNPDKI